MVLIDKETSSLQPVSLCPFSERSIGSTGDASVTLPPVSMYVGNTELSRIGSRFGYSAKVFDAPTSRFHSAPSEQLGASRYRLPFIRSPSRPCHVKVRKHRSCTGSIETRLRPPTKNALLSQHSVSIGFSRRQQKLMNTCCDTAHQKTCEHPNHRRGAQQLRKPFRRQYPSVKRSSTKKLDDHRMCLC